MEFQVWDFRFVNWNLEFEVWNSGVWNFEFERFCLRFVVFFAVWKIGVWDFEFDFTFFGFGI